nr:hypothetical protein [uncultured Acetatifactor sp.]
MGDRSQVKREVCNWGGLWYPVSQGGDGLCGQRPGDGGERRRQ